MSLHASLELGIPGKQLRHLIGKWTHRDYPSLLPHPHGFAVTVSDLVNADPTDRAQLTLNWAHATWAAWTAHHDSIRTWVAEASRARIQRRHARADG